MKRTIACGVIVCLWLQTAVAPPVRADGPPHFAVGRPVDVEHIRLDLKVDLKNKTVEGRATIDGTALRPLETIRLDAVDFDTASVQLALGDAAPANCDHENDGSHLTLMLPRPAAVGEHVRILVDYTLRKPKSGLNFFSPDDGPDAPYVMWSQGQTSYNRHWVPCFDHPNERQTTEIVCTVAEPNTVISNGTLLSEKDNGDGTRTFHWKQSQPHPSYLMTLIVGEFASKIETWRGKPVRYYVREKYKDRIDNSFGNTLAMLDFFSDRIGVEYPWDQYAQTCCYAFGGGMENTSATTLGEGTLHDDRAHLDTSSDGLVAHELAHQWWGDLLTCRDWSHTWLNEGFASYFEALWDEHHEGADEFTYNMFQKSGGAIGGGREKPIVYRDFANEGEQFDSRAYPKGAWVLHMIRRRLGDELFWKCMNDYCERHKFGTVETVDLRKAIEETSGYGFERFFYDWTERPGHPIVTVEYKWRGDDRTAAVTIKQTQKEAAFHFPLRLEFQLDDGLPPVVTTRDVTDKQHAFEMTFPLRPTLFRVDPDNAVLMELTLEQPRDMWETQLKRDANVVARIRAAEHFGKSDSEQDRALLAGQLTADSFWAVQARIARALGDADETGREALLKGLAIKPPKVRAAVVDALGNFATHESVAEALRKLIETGDPSYTVEANAIRAYAKSKSADAMTVLTKALTRDSDREVIRSAALDGLGRTGDVAALDVLIDWTHREKPESCRGAAVRGIAAIVKDASPDGPTVERCVDAVASCLEPTGRSRMSRAALDVLGELGAAAESALPAIDAYASKASSRGKPLAEQTAKRIRDAVAKKRDADESLRRIAELEKANAQLTKRIDELEALTKSAGRQPDDRHSPEKPKRTDAAKSSSGAPRR